MNVIFGRKNGEKTLGVVVKLNEKKAKVRTLEARGSRAKAGVEWGVPYSMLTLDAPAAGSFREKLLARLVAEQDPALAVPLP